MAGSGVLAPQPKTAAPVVAPNMKPEAADLGKQMQAAFNASYAFGRLNPEVVQAALQNGGSLSNTLGFSSPNAIMGLSPEQVNNLAKGGSVHEAIQNASNSMDAIYNGKETRKAMQGLAERLYVGGMGAMERQAGNELSAAQTNANNQQSAYNTEYHGQIQMNEGSANRQSSWDIAKMGRDTQMQIAREHNALEERRLKYLQSMSANNGQAVEAGTMPDVGMTAQYTQQLKNLGALSKDGTALAFSKVPQGQESMALQTYMQREAAKGLPYKTRYNVQPQFQKFLGGYSQLALGRDGWHGIFSTTSKQPGQNTQTEWHVTDMPIVPFRQQPRGGRSGGMGTGGAEGLPVYAPAE